MIDLRRYRSQGFALLETLIAMVLFSIGVLGMVAFQARASQFSGDAEDRTRASLLANEIVTQMWQQAGNPLIPIPTSLTPAQLAGWQVAAANVQRYGLPDGTATVSAPDVSGVVTVSIAWKSISKGSAAATNSLYFTKIVIPPDSSLE